MKNLTHKILLALVLMGMGVSSVFAQSQVKGIVTDSAGDPIIGASVVVLGTSTGETSNVNGEFTLTLPAVKNPQLEISYLGYSTVVIAVVPTQTYYTVVLEQDATAMDEIVVVGYGTQKKSVVTAAISSISNEKIEQSSATRIDNLLQGMTSGVVVTTASGAPDAGSQIRVRGIGSVNNSDPLYIVDGQALSGGIDYLNPSDIERIEVLKDAASAAVYGARAANGVILVTTKKGQKGGAKVNYEYSMGWQNPWRTPEVLNATEYAVMMNEGALNNGSPLRYENPYEFGEGTDWVGAIFNYNAPVVKHDVNISGGTDTSNYSVSAGYLNREGIIGGNFGRSNYERMTLRANMGFNVFDKTKERALLNKLDISTSVSYANIHSTGISANSEYGSPLGSALGMSPIEPIYADEATEASYKELYPTGYPYLIRDAQGRAYTVADGVIYNEQTNPLASLELPGEQYTTDKLVANFAAELQLFEGLKWRSTASADLAFWGSHGYSTQYFLSSKNFNYDTVTTTTQYDKDGNATEISKTNYATSAWQSLNQSLWLQFENVLTYEKQLGDHFISALVGTTSIQTNGQNVGASSKGLQYPYDEWKISVNTTLGKQEDGDRNGWGSWNAIQYHLLSYFGRISYNFGEKYMLEGTLRADGSSRFGSNNKWGYFPSISAGWNVKNEEFMQNVDKISTFKLRASYGVNGSDFIDNFTYAVMMNTGNNYVFGSGANQTESVSTGAKPARLANPNVKWEESIQTDLGAELGLLDNRFTLIFDYYIKETSGMLLEMPVPGYAGDSAPIGNVGSMVNRGMEFEVGWRNRVGDVNYSISANATYNHNELIYLGDESTHLYGSSHKIGQLTRGSVGLPFPYFYGYQSDGIFQNPEEVAAHVNANGELLQPKAAPGDVRFKDIDGNGIINDDDRTMIGKGIPDWTFGLNIALNWQGWDFSMLLQGQYGCQIFNVTRRTDLYYINLPKTILNRWTGEGTTNKYPRFTYESANENYRVSDIWLEDGSYLRARNVQLGYTFPVELTKKAGISRLRVYAQAENLFTLTNYSGCDPEVNGGNGFGTEVGIDRGVYPQSRVFTIGANVTF